MTDSRQARPIVVEALRLVQGREPTLAEIYVCQAVNRFDGGYGNFPSPPNGPEGPTSNNWGAVQHPDLPKYRIYRGVTNPSKSSAEYKAIASVPAPPSPYPKEWFYALDFYPPSKGGKGWFWGPYRVYPNPVDGAAHVARILKSMGVLDVARVMPSWNAVAAKMHEKDYFTGYGDDAKAISDYANNLAAGGEHFSKLFGEVSPLSLNPKAEPAPIPAESSFYSEPASLPILRPGCIGDAVELWQELIGGLVSDGKFGPVTEKRTKAWQKARGLEVTGIVGRHDWAKVK